MKRIFNLSILFAFYSLSAQTPLDTAGKVKPKYKPISLIGMGITAYSGSNGMNQYMLNRLALGGYMSTDEIVNAEKKIKELNRGGFVGQFYIQAPLSIKPDTAYRNKWRIKPSYVQFASLTLTSAMYDLGAFQLIFRGNEPYLGQTLDFGRSNFKQFNSRTFYVGFDDVFLNNIGGKNTRFSFVLGLSQLTSYQNLKLSQGTVYTDSNRNYIDVKYNGNFDNAGRNSAAGVGYGLVTKFELNWKNAKNRYLLSLANFGVYYLPEVVSMKKEMQNPVRINQTKLGAKNLNTDNWIDGLKDSINEGLAPDSAVISKIILAPVRLNFMMYTDKLVIGLDYFNMPGYIPRLTLRRIKPVFIKGRISMNPELQLGGFDTYDVNLNMGIWRQIVGPHTGKEVTGHLKVQGIEALILPRLEHGAGITFGLNYLLN